MSNSSSIAGGAFFRFTEKGALHLMTIEDGIILATAIAIALVSLNLFISYRRGSKTGWTIRGRRTSGEWGTWIPRPAAICAPCGS